MDGETRRAQLRGAMHAQTARIAYVELQRFFAAGRLICVDGDLDLVEVAVELALDNTARFERWLAAGKIARVADAQAQQWLAENRELWAVVADPWVLVQQRAE